MSYDFGNHPIELATIILGPLLSKAEFGKTANKTDRFTGRFLFLPIDGRYIQASSSYSK